MSTTRFEERPPAVALVAWTAAVAAVATVAVAVLPFVRFAYPAPALHVVLETTNALIALLVAYLIYGRYRESRRWQDLLLLLALCTVATANLVLTALPSAVALASGDELHRWQALLIRLVGTLVLTLAALAPAERRVRRWHAVSAAMSIAALVVVVSVAATLLADGLPPTVDPALALPDASRPRLVAHPVVLVAQAVGAVLYTVAAVAFTWRALRGGDELMRWVGAGCVLAAFSRVHYLLFPSLYSDFVYTGDLLRLGFFVFMLIGASREIRSYWAVRARAAVLEDRRRMARDLHDGLAQELTYIRAQAQRLAADQDVDIARRITAAAGRAADEARRAISALTRPVGEAFPAALERVVDELAHRHDIKIVTGLDQTTEVDPAVEEALLRIVSEAVHNGVRHGGASRIEVRLTAQPLQVSVRDDGRGFDASTRAAGGFGLTSMRERAQGVGAALDISSVPGEGTTVTVRWP
ncbi:sensor histidine kinase [Blastococcus saxobsidens]|uniref:Histidine kinase domain-containing protein n=1 Tax=Blastococcus saxobsidens (strain DD2) TaxID=1146883 RepID=H6RUD2_BLASD|nr:ATP-binding protein [Blastococcus saxobsidens]CCG01897.1 membrane protein of unknown function [Blastococcus saxobsidens DD2]